GDGLGAAAFGSDSPFRGPILVLDLAVVPGRRGVIGEAELLDGPGERRLILLGAEAVGGGSVSLGDLSLTQQGEELLGCVHDRPGQGEDAADEKGAKASTQAHAQDAGGAAADPPACFHRGSSSGQGVRVRLSRRYGPRRRNLTARVRFFRGTAAPL